MHLSSATRWNSGWSAVTDTIWATRITVRITTHNDQQLEVG